MKFSSLILAVLVSTTLFGCQKAATPNSDTTSPAGPVSEMGGADGGGGDLPLSTEKQVRDAIDYARKFQFKHAAYNLALMEDEIQEPYVRQIFAKFFNDNVGQQSDWFTSQPLIMDFKSSEIKIEERAGCRDADGVDHAAGVAKRELGSAVCLSLPKLRLVEPDSLRKQVLSLMFHEFAHHFGFGELEAEKLQAFVSERSGKIDQLPQELSVSFKKRLEIPAPAKPRNYQYDVNYFIAGGRVVEATFETEDELRTSQQAYCAFSVRWEDGKPKASTASFDRIALALTNASSFSDFKEKIGFFSMSYMVNPHFNGSYRESSGARFYSPRDRRSEGKVHEFYCRSEDLHVMDLKLIFGAFGGSPDLR